MRGIEQIPALYDAMMAVAEASGFRSWWQDLIQPAWTLVSGGCYPNRDTEATVRAAGFTIDRAGRRSRRNVRLFAAREAKPVSHQPSGED